MRTFWIVFLCVLVLCIVLAALNPSSRQHSRAPVAAAAPSVTERAATSPPVRVAANRLISDYIDSPATADREYEGRELIVTGVVGRVAQFAMEPGEPYRDSIDFKTERIGVVRCLAAPGVSFARVHAGQRIALHGRFAEKRAGVFLTDCEVATSRADAGPAAAAAR